MYSSIVLLLFLSYCSDKLSRNALEMSLGQLHTLSPPLFMFVVLADSYHQQRMLLGVAEGVREILPENALPFEFNLDYMNGGT